MKCYKLKKGFRKYELSVNGKNIIATESKNSLIRTLKEIGMDDYSNKLRKLKNGVCKK